MVSEFLLMILHAIVRKERLSCYICPYSPNALYYSFSNNNSEYSYIKWEKFLWYAEHMISYRDADPEHNPIVFSKLKDANEKFHTSLFLWASTAINTRTQNNCIHISAPTYEAGYRLSRIIILERKEEEYAWVFSFERFIHQDVVVIVVVVSLLASASF